MIPSTTFLVKSPSCRRAYDVCCKPLRNPKDQNLQRCRSYALRILNTTCWDKPRGSEKLQFFNDFVLGLGDGPTSSGLLM